MLTFYWQNLRSKPLNNCDISEIRDDRRIAEYQKNIRGFMRALWNGSIDFDQFFDLMMSGVRVGLTQVWYAGAEVCGIKPDDLTPAEKSALDAKIANERAHVFDVAEYITQNLKADGVKLVVINRRAALWGQRALDVYNTAKAMACGDKKLKWVMDPVKEHCDSCVKLNGKVKRASYWRDHGVLPQNPPNPRLQCRGWKCGCSLNPTDDPVSRGPLPRLP